MYEKKHLIVCMVVSILLSMVAACGPTLPSPQQAAPTLSTGAEQVKGRLTAQDGRIVEYEILVPQSWTGKYEVREEGNIAFFDYNASPKNTLFSIAAFTEAQWQEVQQEPGHGTALLSQDGIVFVYNIALANPYTGSQAEEFQQMAGQVQNVVSSLTVSIISTAAEMEEAREVLIAFFDLLSKDNYARAAELYGGTCENLIDMNPDADPNDHAALLERACTINGFQCLQIKEVVQEVQDWPDIFTFTLEFANPDGSLFVLDTCCGTTGTDMLPQSRFDFTVMRVPQLGNIFLVQGLPVYVP